MEDKKQEKRKYFVPSFSNRNLLKNDLVNEFAGYTSFHKSTSNNYGHHVPFCNIYDLKILVKTTYEIPQLGAIIIFTANDSLIINLNIFIEDLSFIKVIAVPDNHELCQLLSISNYACLITPDGYIGAYGDFEYISGYIEKYHQ